MNRLLLHSFIPRLLDASFISFYRVNCIWHTILYLILYRVSPPRSTPHHTTPHHTTPHHTTPHHTICAVPYHPNGCRQKGMGKYSELYSGILTGVDLSPTDQLVGMMLLASLQRMRRRHYIIRALVAAAPGDSLDACMPVYGILCSSSVHCLRC